MAGKCAISFWEKVQPCRMENDAQLPFLCRESFDMVMNYMRNQFMFRNHLTFDSDVLSTTSNLFHHQYP